MLVAAIGVMAKEAIAPVVLVALIAEVTSVTVPVPMYSLAGVAAANTAVPLKLVSPNVRVLTKVLKPLFDRPAVVSVVPLKVRLAESASKPLVEAKVTRPEVRPESVIDELETPVRPVRDVTHCGAVPVEVMTLFAAPMAKKVVVSKADW